MEVLPLAGRVALGAGSGMRVEGRYLTPELQR